MIIPLFETLDLPQPAIASYTSNKSEIPYADRALIVMSA